MDEDSILFQAMKNEMMPQVDPAAMRVIDPGSEYNLGVEIRTRNPMNRGGGGSVANPLRMQQQPSDWTGRPAHANANPANVRPDSVYDYNRTPIRPAENVINQYQGQMQQQRLRNQTDRMMAEAQKRAETEVRPNAPDRSQRVLQWIRNFFNANRPPNSGLFD